MSTHANNVANAVSGAPGTGTITLGSAVSGSQSFSAAYGANATVDVFITDGTAWEVARACTYTHSGTTLTRGTLEASSTGSAISLTSAAVARVAASADSGRRWDAAALEQSTVTGTSGAITAEVNRLYVADMSGWTADRTLTLPATAAVGDRVGVMVSVGYADYEWLITAASGDTLNAVAGGTEWSRVFITGEVVVMRCVAADASWVVESDGRIPCVAGMLKNSTTSVANVTATKIALNTLILDSAGGVADPTTNNRFNIRRANKYRLAAKATADSAQITAHQTRTHKNGSLLFNQPDVIDAYSSAAPSFGIYSLAVGDYIELYYYHSTGGTKTYYGDSGDATSHYLQELL